MDAVIIIITYFDACFKSLYGGKSMEPFKLCAVTKNIIWGGGRLAREYGKGIPGEKIAEFVGFHTKSQLLNRLMDFIK